MLILGIPALIGKKYDISYTNVFFTIHNFKSTTTDY